MTAPTDIAPPCDSAAVSGSDHRLVVACPYIRAECASLRAECNALRESRDGWSEKHAQLQDSHDAACTELAALKSERDALTIENETVRNHRVELNQTCEYLRAELAAVTAERDALKAQVEVRGEMRDEAIEEMNKAVAERDALKAFKDRVVERMPMLLGGTPPMTTESTPDATSARLPFRVNAHGFVEDATGSRVLVCSEDTDCTLRFNERAVESDGHFMCPNCGRLGQRMVEARPDQCGLTLNHPLHDQ